MKTNKWIDDLQVGTKSEVIANPYTGLEIELNPLEIAVYDFIKGCEAMRLFKTMHEGCNWFIDNNPKAYRILLD